MSNNDFNSDLDAILAEFASYSSSIKEPESSERDSGKAAPVENRAPRQKPEPEAKQGSLSGEQAEYYVDMSMLTGYLQKRQSEMENKNRNSAPEAPGEEFSPDFKPSGREYTRPEAWTRKKTKKKAPPPEPNVDKVLSASEQKKAQDLRQMAEDKQARRQAERSALRQTREQEDIQHFQARERRQRSDSPLKIILSVICVFLSFGVLGWTALNVHPDSGTSDAAAVESKLHLAQDLDVYMNNAYADALGDMAYIKKIYTIPESASAAPRPNPASFGETSDPAVIQSVIDDASELLNGQKTLWQPELHFYPGTTMQYYRDDSILVLTWKEVYDERCCTMAEVMVAHGSQFRRRIAEDSYSSSVQLYASEMAKASNAVVASNADFYAFRTFGVTVYQRQLFRAEPGKLDTCFVTSTGDMLFAKAGELTSQEQISRYIKENDVLFSLSFGPVLVDNGQLQYCEAYPIGEIDTQYSRAGLGMLGERHYLLMTVNHTDGRPRANVNQFGQYMYEKGCIKAYNLDGGQTSEIVMNGEPVNYIDFGAERTVSDIIYFASAIPESEWSRGEAAK